MDYKLKNRDGVETTYTKEKLKIPAAINGVMAVFTQGEAQAKKSVDITANGAFTVEPDAGYAFVKMVSGTVNVPASEPVLQEKSVNIVSNGQTSVSPDEGKDGLSKVDITVNVPGADFSQVTATAADVLQGKAFLNAQGNLEHGNIPDKTGTTPEVTYVEGVTHLHWPKGYYSKDIYYNYTAGRYNISILNTTYHSDPSYQYFNQVVETALTSGQQILGAPAWLIGIGFKINGNWMFAMNTVFAIQTSDLTSFTCVGGIDAGDTSIRMELSGTISTDSVVSYTLNKLEFNGTDIKAMVSASTDMRLMSLYGV